ncbi:MAG TPA: hypothetical protein VEB64_17765 [Azospirillaceae bacterium]|nr:hypothetical protein [Azospirillaceae bacterium]
MSYRFLPSTFERRGVALPFDRKILRYARLRIDDAEDRHQWHVVLPYHASARRGTVAILPWLQLPQFTDLTPRDQALVTTLGKIRVSRNQADPAVDPLQVRTILLSVDGEMGATPERQARARREASMDSQIKGTVHLHLFANLVQEFAKDIQDEVLTNMTGPLYRQLSVVARQDANLKLMVDRFAAKVVDHAGSRLGLSPEHVTKRMDDLADIMVPLGRIDMEDLAAAAAMGQAAGDRVQDGFLVRARDDLRWLHGEMDAFLVNAREELRYPLEMILFSVDQFLKTVGATIDDVERGVHSISNALQRYESVRPRIAQARLRVAWILDGWGVMVNLWRDTLDRVAKSELTPDGKMQIADLVELERVITTIFQNMPTMPDSEVKAIQAQLEAWNHFESTRAKVVQAGCDWGASKPDEELRQRMAKVRPLA